MVFNIFLSYTEFRKFVFWIRNYILAYKYMYVYVCVLIL